MKLLIVTQALDLDDPLLSAYHGWVEALAQECDSVEAVCLKEGRHQLPENVTVHSLGKESGARSSLSYALSFLLLAWELRRTYDAVFVHMNEEYLIVAGPLWKLLRKPAFLWRNHYDGSWKTDIAAFWSTNVFCTSKRSYTAKYAKTVFMPVGVNLERFDAAGSEARVPRSVLFFSRLTPSKRPELLIDALSILAGKGVAFSASFYGSAREGDESYAAEVRARAASLGERVTFRSGVRNEDAPSVYRSHELFVNCSPSGMLDKTIFEAAASGCLVLAESIDLRENGFADMTYEPEDAGSLALEIERMLVLTDAEKGSMRERLSGLADENRLTGLAKKLVVTMSEKR